MLLFFILLPQIPFTEIQHNHRIVRHLHLHILNIYQHHDRIDHHLHDNHCHIPDDAFEDAAEPDEKEKIGEAAGDNDHYHDEDHEDHDEDRDEDHYGGHEEDHDEDHDGNHAEDHDGQS